MSLDATTRRRYERQLLLGEIGEEGQERLSKAAFCRGPGSDPIAYDVASDYLRRAGCPEHETDGEPICTPTSKAVADFAGTPSLRGPAAAVLGALAAVEHLKATLGLGRPTPLPPKRGLSPFTKG